MMYNYNVYAAMRQLGVTRLRTKQSKVLSCILQNRDVLVRLCTGRRQIAPFPAPGSPRRAGTADPRFFSPARPAGGPGLRVEEEGRSRRPPQLEPQQAPPRSDFARLRAERRPAVPCPRAASQSQGSRGACLRACAPRCRGRGAHSAAGRPRFSPAYSEIGAFIKSLRIPPQILAFTATGDRFGLQLYRAQPAYG